MNRFLLSAALVLATALVARAEIRVPAFTAYSIPDAQRIRISSRAGVSDWKDPGQQVVWYGDFKNTGGLTASLVLKLPKDQSSRLKLTIGSQSHEATAQGTGEEITVPFGNFEIAEAGYASITLTSLNKEGAPAGDIATLVIDGPATKDAHFNLEKRRNAASVHLNYTTPKDAQFDAFYCEVTAVEDPIHTFYMACGFQRGYFGMQVISPTERLLIFSVWDSGAGTGAMKRDVVAKEDQTQLLAKGEGVNTKIFGGEGTGGHSNFKYLWKTGEKQRFILTAKAGEGETAIYSGYWFHPETKQWKLLARFQAPKAQGTIERFHSFSENFVGNNGHLQRKALFCNQWVHTTEGKWEEVTEASFSHDGTGKEVRLDRYMGVEDGCFFLAHGGFKPGFTKFGERFTRPATGTPPGDIDFKALEAL